jgi:hypothetical protein
MDDKLPMTLRSETKAQLFASDKKIGNFVNESLETQLTLADGDNNITLKTLDAFLNESDIQTVKIFALVQPTWKKFSCAGITMALSSSIQIGFSGVENRTDAAAVQYAASTRKGDCRMGNTSVYILPRGTKAPCYECDGSIDYIMFAGGTAHDFDSLTSNITKYRDQDKNYTTKFGIAGKLQHYQVPSIDYEIMTEAAHDEWFFIFDHQNYKYFFRAKRFNTKFYDSVYKDFETLVNSFVVA